MLCQVNILHLTGLFLFLSVAEKFNEIFEEKLCWSLVGVEGLMLVTELFSEMKLMETQLLEIFWSAFNSHMWPRQNFSSQYQYNIK